MAELFRPVGKTLIQIADTQVANRVFREIWVLHATMRKGILRTVIEQVETRGGPSRAT